MTQRILYVLVGAIVVFSLATGAGAQEPGAGQDGPEWRHQDHHRALSPESARLPVPEGQEGGPATTDTGWSDTFGDDIGFTSMSNTATVAGDVVLTQIEALGYAAQGGNILSMTVGPSGKVYLGTSGAYLNVYDPVTRQITYICAPVPDECFT